MQTMKQHLPANTKVRPTNSGFPLASQFQLPNKNYGRFAFTSSNFYNPKQTLNVNNSSEQSKSNKSSEQSIIIRTNKIPDRQKSGAPVGTGDQFNLSRQSSSQTTIVRPGQPHSGSPENVTRITPYEAQNPYDNSSAEGWGVRKSVIFQTQNARNTFCASDMQHKKNVFFKDMGSNRVNLQPIQATNPVVHSNQYAIATAGGGSR